MEAGSRDSCPWSEWAIRETDRGAALGCVMRPNTDVLWVTGEAVGRFADSRPGVWSSWAGFKVTRWY